MAPIAIAIPDPTAGRPPRHRRNYPRSLRIFVWIQLLAGIGGVLFVGIPAYRQWNAIHALERPNVLIGMGPGNYEWLRPWLGKDYMKMFARVEKVILDDDGITDGDLAHLNGFPHLKTLHLSGKQITMQVFPIWRA